MGFFRIKKFFQTLFVALALPSLSYADDFEVTNTDQNGPGSLGQAINDANGDPNAPTVIKFNLAADAYSLINPLPAITRDLMLYLNGLVLIMVMMKTNQI